MRKIVLLAGVGVLLRLVFIGVGIHPDIRANYLAAYIIAQKGEVFSFYDYISRLPRNHSWVGIYGDGQFNYPPLAHLSHGLFNFLLWPVYPRQAFDILINDYGNFRGSAGSVFLLFLLKLPYVIADILCLVFLTKLFPDSRRKRLATVLWLVNPFVLYSAYLMGQFDIFIALFFILAIYAFHKDRNSLAAVCLGISAGFKPFSLVMLPFVTRSRWKSIFLGVGTYGLIILPYLHSVAFKTYALLAAQSDKPLYAKIMVSGSQHVPLFILGLVALFWWSRYRPAAFPGWGWLSVPLFLFFSVTHWHPQWLTWLAPFLVLAWVEVEKTRWPIVVLTLAYLVIVLTFDSSLNFGLVGLKLSFAQFLPANYTLDFVASLFRGVLAATSLAIVLLMRKGKDV